MAAVAVGLATALAAWAHARSDDEGAVVVRHLALDARPSASGDRVLLRAAFEVDGPPHRWYGVYFHLRADEQTPLRNDGGRHLLEHWGDLFAPAGRRPARWTEVRMAVPVADIAAAENLPRPGRGIVWAVCDLWDHQRQRYVGSGWPLRVPLVVESDAQGALRAVRPFSTRRHDPIPSREDARVPALRCRLELEHLQPRPGLEVYRAVTAAGAGRTLAAADGRQAALDGPDRGWFFGPIETAAQARELLLLGYPGAVVLRRRAVFEEVARELGRHGWRSGAHMALEPPPVTGVEVEEEPGLGFRVRALLITLAADGGRRLGDVMEVEAAVATDGRLGVQERVRIRAPDAERDGRTGGGALPAGPAAYDEVVRGVLRVVRQETAPVAARPTRERVLAPCAEDERPEAYLADYAAWPPDAWD